MRLSAEAVLPPSDPTPGLVAVVGVSLDGTILSWNSAATHTFGYEAEETLGRSIDLLLDSSSRAVVGELLKTAAKGQQSPKTVACLRRHDGETLQVTLWLEPIPNLGGHLTAARLCLQFHSDDRSTAPREESESRAHFGYSARITLSSELSLESSDPSIEQICGYTADDLRHKSWLDVVFTEDRERVGRTLVRLLEEPGDGTEEYRLRKPDGQIAWVRSRLTTACEENTRSLRGVLSDITERKLAEGALQHVVSGTAASGPGFFRSLVEHLARALDVPIAYVSQCIDRDEDRMRLLAAWEHDGLGDTFDYLVRTTASEKLRGEDLVWLSRGVAEQYPNDIWVRSCGADSFLGLALRSSSGELIGHLAVMDSRPLRREIHAASLLRIFAARVAAEIERQHAEAALVESEERFRTLAQSAPVGIFLCDPEGECRFVNPSWTQLTGLSEEQALGSGWTKAIHLDDRERVVSSWQQAVSSGQDNNDEFRFRKPNGEVVWVSGRTVALADGLGRVQSYVGTITDVTTLKLTEQRHSLENEVTIALAAGTFDEVSPLFVQAVNRSLGWSLTELWVVEKQTQSLRLLATTAMSAEDLSAVRAATPSVALSAIDSAPGATWSCQSTLWTADLTAAADPTARAHAIRTGLRTSLAVPIFINGETYAILTGFSRTVLPENAVVIEAMQWAAEQLERFVERHELQEQLHQAQKMEAVGQLAGGIAHDFNNLLTVISGHSELLSLEPGLDEDQRESVAAIQEAMTRAADLTQQLLAYSRRQVMRARTVDLFEVVAGMRRMLATLIGETIELKIESDGSPCLVHLDPSRMEQVILNLAANARDAMPGGGELTMTCRAAPGNAVEEVELLVADTGVGMDARTAARIFEPFFTTKALGKGTGLGLATAYGIVKQSGGHIEAKSEEGEGTVFILTFSRSEAGTPERIVEPDPIGPLEGSETILLVEDDDLVRQLSADFLSQQGYSILAAADGDEALALAEQCPGAVDLLLTDVVLRGMPSNELAQRLLESNDSLRVVSMSGHAEETVDGVQTLAQGFVQKPFRLETLALKVREVLDEPR